MTWLLKAYIQKAIGLLPASERLNYFFQKRITKNLPISDETLDEKVVLAAKRTDLFSRFNNTPLKEARFLEFGAGWDLTGPLATYALGVGKQTLLDITPHLRFELINNVLDRLRLGKDHFKEITGRSQLPFPGNAVKSSKDLLEWFNIEYLAPLDASRTGFSENSLDFISTNSTLEHIPAQELPPIMKESFRILKPGGLICHLIDMKDHYSYFDRSISKYNFLKYSEPAWKRYNTSLQYQNRLRISRYKAFIENAGFEIVYEDIDRASDKELQELRSLALHSDFKNNFSEEEISAQIYRVVARKPTGKND